MNRFSFDNSNSFKVDRFENNQVPLEESSFECSETAYLSFFFADKTTRTETRISAKPKEGEMTKRWKSISRLVLKWTGRMSSASLFFTDGGRNHFFVVVKLMTAGR
jgi:hypothetical protein